MADDAERVDWSARAREIAFETRPFIGGRYVESLSGDTFDKFNPADGSLLARFAVGSGEDVSRAVAAACAAFNGGIWAHASVDHRKAVLHRLADLMAAHAEELALLETLDVGKPIRDALNVDVPLAIGILRHAAEAADHVLGQVHPTDGRSLALAVRVPRGVAAGIVGWNFPLVLAVQKLAPALATGNSLVLKPSELSSLSALRLAALAVEAGVPESVFNVVPGLGATVGDAIAHHMDIDLLSFTGSSATGKRLLQASGASNMKRLVLECGGKSPNIVFADAPDLDLVADGVMARMFWNQGQVCTAGTRLLVDQSVKDALVERLLARVAGIVPGHPLDPGTTFGPLISAGQRDKVMGYIEGGLGAGASLRAGGGDASAEGYYVAPAVFDNVTTDMRIAQEEIFGPVLSILPFSTIDEAVSLANATVYGLSATVWTQSLATAQRMIRDLNVGELVIRGTGTPSAGAKFGALPLEPHGQSGLGIESGIEGLAAYTALKSVQLFV
ncbi:aldehyde dehydrogenase family protein [Sphingosinicella sp.]|uniref:aldehyde dehydrogenase family protein n=1 Tax=Sphingosinicella sp. TaxID=1917971 RepID=UPI0035B35DDD